MGPSSLAILAVVPGLFWLWVFHRRDRWEKEPVGRVLGLFGLGFLISVPVYFVEGMLPGPRSDYFDAFVRIALIEEFFKSLPIVFCVYRSRAFNEPMDGIVYGVAVGLGFATAENVLYTLAFGPPLLFARAFTSTLMHAALTGLLGYAFARRKFNGTSRIRVKGLFLAVVAFHGAYDLLLGWSADPATPALFGRGAILLTIPFLLGVLHCAANRACAQSPFRADQCVTVTPRRRGRESHQDSGNTVSDTTSIQNPTASSETPR